MKRALVLSLLFCVALLSCKNKEKIASSPDEPVAETPRKGPDLSKDIQILREAPENLRIITPAEGAPGKDFTIGGGYAESVERVYFQGAFGFMIKGSLPDGCSTLHKIEAHLSEKTLTLDMATRRPAGAMCTQALVPFSFFLADIDETTFEMAENWVSGDAKGTIQ